MVKMLNKTPQKTVKVQSKYQLAGDLDLNTLYEIYGEIDMGDISISSLSGYNIKGRNPNIDKLVSSEDNFTLFSGNTGGIVINGVGIEVTGTNSKVFDVDNTSSGGFDELSMTDCNFNNCTSLGVVTGYRQGFWDNIGIINCLDGVTLAGDWLGGFRATASIVLNMPSGGVAFRAGAGLVFNNRFITDMNFSNIQAGATAIDFSPTNFTNDNTFIIRDATFTGAGSYLPNTLPSNDVALFVNNTGLEDTYIGGIWVLDTEVETVIATANTPVKIAGTTVYNSLAHFTSNGNNSLEKTTSQPVQVDVKCNLSFAGNNGDEAIVHIYKWDNEAQSYIEIKQSGGDTVNQGGKAEGVNLNYPVSMKILDRIELRVSNATAGRNLTLLANSDCQISKR